MTKEKGEQGLGKRGLVGSPRASGWSPSVKQSKPVHWRGLPVSQTLVAPEPLEVFGKAQIVGSQAQGLHFCHAWGVLMRLAWGNILGDTPVSVLRQERKEQLP